MVIRIEFCKLTVFVTGSCEPDPVKNILMSKVQPIRIACISVLTILVLMLTIRGKWDQKPEVFQPGDPGRIFDNPDLQLLGEKLFFDATLSDPPGQSCATCHDPETGWTGSDELVNRTGGVYPGAVKERYGNRKPNSAAYATLSPTFHAFKTDNEVQFAGGNFWDGRATGLVLGNPAADQAQGPFLNPVEQNLPDAVTLVNKVCNSPYVSLFEKVATGIWGVKNICSSRDINLQFGIIGNAIAAFENSSAVNQFSSKFDHFLKGEAGLTPNELEGLKLFEGKAKCAKCHTSKPEMQGVPPLFTDFTFENVGVPRNPQNPWYTMDVSLNSKGPDWVDPGLGGYLMEVPEFEEYAVENLGKHQVPTLRNVDKRLHSGFIKAFGHNGYFKSLEEIIHFYNTRDVLPVPEKVTNPLPGINCWPKPEVTENLNREETGNLGLTKEEETAIVAFLRTLSDGYETGSGKK